MKTLWTLGLAFFFALSLISCDDDDGRQTGGSLTLSFSGIAQAGDDYVYGIWTKENGEYVYLDEFSINNDGSSTNSVIGVDQDRLNTVEGVLITLERKDNIGMTPSALRIMAGEFVNRGALLEISNADAMGVDFSSSSASYMLASPTDDNASNENAGVWFADISNGSSTLNLPTLPAEWTYESWALLPDTTVSLGRFTDPLQADDSNAHSGPNPQNGFNTPGGDLLTGDADHFPANLNRNFIRISVEPTMDNDAAAFGIRPFFVRIVDSIPTSPIELEYRESGIIRGQAIKN